MSRMNVNNNKSNGRKKLQREMNFLNGNSVSFLNGFARKQNRQPAQRNIGQQQRTKRVNAPVSSGFAGLSSKARITTMDSGVTRVKHSEYVKDIDSSADFSAESFPINPGTSELFPWLSTIAARFESYQFKDLNIRFETTSPTNTSGTAIITVDYNPKGIVPASKTQALAMESAVRAPVWGSVNHRSLRHNLTKRKSYYVRGRETLDADSDLYDTGIAVMMVEGVAVDSIPQIGEMYVDYEVDLITPVLDLDTGTTDETLKLVSQIPATAVDGKFPFDVTISADPPNNVGPGGTISVGPGLAIRTSVGIPNILVGSIYFRKPGDYLVVFEWNSLDGIPLNPANFAYGTAITTPGSNYAITPVNITPGGGIVMVDAADSARGMSMFAVQVKRGPDPANLTLFGIGSVTTQTPGNFQVTTRLTDYSAGLL